LNLKLFLRRTFLFYPAKKGPYSGTRHQFLVYRTARLSLPSNPEYSVPQLKMMLSEVEKILGRTIAVDEWNNL